MGGLSGPPVERGVLCQVKAHRVPGGITLGRGAGRSRPDEPMNQRTNDPASLEVWPCDAVGRPCRLSAMDDGTSQNPTPKPALRTLAEPTPLSDTTDAERATVDKARGHPVRVKLLRPLAERMTCVYELLEVFPLAQSTVPQHLKVLKDAGLIRGIVSGPRTLYCVEPAALTHMKSIILGFGS